MTVTANTTMMAALSEHMTASGTTLWDFIATPVSESDRQVVRHLFGFDAREKKVCAVPKWYSGNEKTNRWADPRCSLPYHDTSQPLPGRDNPQCLVRVGLATAEPETVRAGKRQIEVVRMTITVAGRRALAGST
jgi:hypothetical protein